VPDPSAIAADLAPLGALAERVAKYVLSGDDADVLDVVAGKDKDIKLNTSAWWGPSGRITAFGAGVQAGRKVIATFGDGDEAALERLGRVYAAAAGKEHIHELEGELGWLEHLVWESGDNTPQSSCQCASTLRLELVERRMKDTRPLVTAVLLQEKDFGRYAFAQTMLGCADIADFFVRNKEIVCQLLHLADPKIIERLDQANVPVAPFADALAELASDGRVTLRRPALKLLARDALAASAALRTIASDDDRKPKQRELASRALGLLGASAKADEAPSNVEAELDVPPLSASARAKLRALCDEWLAQATPRFALHRVSYPHASSSWIDPIDDATLERAIGYVEQKKPWTHPREKLLERLLKVYVVSIGRERIDEVLADPDFAPVHAVRLLALVFDPGEYFAGLALSLLARRHETEKPCTLEEVRTALHYTSVDPALTERALLNDDSEWDSEEAAVHLAKRQEALEVILGARSATWFDVKGYWSDRARKTVCRFIQTMPPAVIGKPLREALWRMATAGSKVERPLAQACLVRFPGYEQRLVDALGDGASDVRANAAAWIAHAKIPSARAPLRAAFAKEKNAQARANMMTALEAVGEPLDALMDRAGLPAKSKVTLTKAKCAVLEWPEVCAIVDGLKWADTGGAVEGDIVRAWIAETHKAKSPVPSPLLRLYARVLHEPERDAFALALLDAWIGHDTAGSATTAIQDKGILAVVAAFGRHDIAGRCASYLKTHYGMRAAQCKALLQMLAHVDDKAAVQLLLAIATRFRTAGIRIEAELQSKELAERRGWTIDEMADRTIPTGGLDDRADESLVLSYGARSFVARIDAGLALTLHTQDGAPIKALPAAHKDEDDATVKAAKATFTRARKEIESVIKMQRDRLYEAMCTQRTWRYDDWHTLLASHPIVRHLITGVVWVAKTGDGPETSFRPLGDGTLTTADHHDVALTPDATIRVAHPLTMDVANWVANLADFEVLPLFPQLGRSVHRLPEGGATKKENGELVGHMIEAFKLRSRATALGYVRGPSEDGGWFFQYVKVFPSLGLSACLRFSGNGLPEENRTVALGAFSFEKAGDGATGALTLGSVPPVLLSEVWADMEDIAGLGTGFDAAWESKVS